MAARKRPDGGAPVEQQAAKKGRGGGGQSKFLKQLLEVVENEQYESIHFDDSGTKVIIDDWPHFVSNCMPEKFEKVKKSE